MKKPSLYLLLSALSLLFDLFFCVGIIGSIILLFLCSAEKRRIITSGFYEDYDDDLNKLKWAKIISVLNILFIIASVIGFIFFLVLYFYR